MHPAARVSTCLAPVVALFLTTSLSTATDAPIPPTPKKPVTDKYHGQEVVEDYRWLENWEDPTVKKWSDAENRYARAYLDALPNVSEIRQRVTELLKAKYVSYGGLEWRGGKLFASKFEPPKQQPFLIVLSSADDPGSARVLLDPNQLDAKGTTAIDFYVPSLDGKYVAVSISHGGSESGDVHVYDTATGKEKGDIVPRVNGGTAGGSLAWNSDASGFYYTRYPRGQERPEADLGFFQQVYFHKLGAPTADDRYEIGRDFPRIAEIALHSSEDGRTILAAVENGDGGEFAMYIRSPAGKWNQVTQFADKVVKAALSEDQALFLLSRDGAPRGKILKLSLAEPELAKAKTIIPESEAVIETILPTRTRLYLVDQLGGPSQIRVFDHDGGALKPVETLAVSAVGGLTRLEGDDILFSNTSFTQAPAWYRFDSKTSSTKRTALFNTNPTSFADTEVVREFATSKDGTKVPISILCRKGTKLDHSNPTLLTGYGGYGVSMSPGFSATRRIWLDQGGVWAIANLRGGGEFGEEWHKAGNLTRKQNVFDDFAACMKYLVEKGYTSRDKLAIEGGSNGGLLMGAELVQHPDMMKAVISHVGIYDMLRVELSPNGVFNVTEFGTVKDPEQFKALYAYSPLHHVEDGTKYPAVLFLTGANDPRVEPWNSRKMTARLQAACPTCTVLLRTSADSGHGIGTGLNERIEQQVDVFAFLFKQLGLKYQPTTSYQPPERHEGEGT